MIIKFAATTIITFCVNTYFDSKGGKQLHYIQSTHVAGATLF